MMVLTAFVNLWSNCHQSTKPQTAVCPGVQSVLIQKISWVNWDLQGEGQAWASCLVCMLLICTLTSSMSWVGVDWWLVETLQSCSSGWQFQNLGDGHFTIRKPETNLEWFGIIPIVSSKSRKASFYSVSYVWRKRDLCFSENDIYS